VAEEQQQASGPSEQSAGPKRGIHPKTGQLMPIGRPWQKGCPSPNPAGRRLTQELDLQLDADTTTLLIRALVGKALGGDVPALKEILERHEGKVLQSVSQDTTQRTIVIEAGMDETPDPLEES
jgi:hypothetical protein